MKKSLLLGLVMMFSAVTFAQNNIDNSFFDKVNFRGAFGTTDWTSGWANFNPNETDYAAPTATIEAGNITTNTTWTKNNVYLLNGWVYVKDGATLTIEAGTVIRGDKTNKGSLIIEKGGKLIAEGTAAEPIVFTSNQNKGSRTYGDWGGIIICGQAPINPSAGTATIEGGVGSTYGGTNAADNSGSLKYVRIEFPGIAFVSNSEINGLTLGGVGAATTLDYVQVSYSGDDSFEWFGGSVNAKHLIAYKGWDDDFDTDFGFSGMVQFAVALRDPAIADQSKSNSFESDNDATGSSNAPFTSAVFSNVSSFGPLATPTTTINSLYQTGMHIRRNSELQVYNSVFAGWPKGLILDGNATHAKATANALKIRNSVLAASTSALSVPASQNWDITALTTWFNSVAFRNDAEATNEELKITAAFNQTAPSFVPGAGSELLGGSSWATSAVQTVSANNLSVYPNPVNNEFTVEFAAAVKNASVELFNLNGQLIAQLYAGAVADGKIMMNRNNIESGMYIIKATADKNVTIAKILIK